MDGPGIRTTVFTKGCPLRCVWCHNPETQSTVIEKGYGRMASVDEIVAECLKDRVYYELSGGGVTVSGGEPMTQPDFTLAILESLKRAGIHTTLDTSGYGPLSAFDLSLPVTDLYLFDYKATNPRTHHDLMSAPLRPILRALDRLLSRGAKIILRCPMVPSVNDSVDHLQAIVGLTQRYPSLLGVEVLPWHTMGNAKYQKLSMTLDPRLPLENVPALTIERYRSFFRDHGASQVVVVS